MTSARRRPAVARRTLLGAAAAGGAALAASACARIPGRSGITAVPVGQAQAGTAPYVQSRPPEDGASPAQIVAGFVQAGVGAEDDFGVARSYLTPAAQVAWDPHASVTVYAGDQGVSTAEGEAGEVALTVEAVGQVDALGVRTALASSSQRSIDVQLQQVDGQWRIASPPAGIYLSQQVFEILFIPGHLYFLGSREMHLVPDVRWVPSQDRALSLLRHLARGPAPFLRGAVHTAVPAALATAEITVTTTGTGAVRVDLPSSVSRLPDDRRGPATVQISASLASLPLLGEVELHAGGTSLEVPDATGLASPVEGGRAIGAGDTGIIALAAAPPSSGGQQVPALAGQAVRAPALSGDGALAAALRPDEAALLVAGTSPDAPARTVEVGVPLVAPCIDDTGRVWTARRDREGGLLVLDGADAAGPVPVGAGWLGGREIIGIDISADATRMVVASVGPEGHHLDLCGIARDGAGRPLTISEPVGVPVAGEGIVQVTWYDETSVLVVQQGQDGTTSGSVVGLSGSVEHLPTLPAGVVRVAGTALSGVFYGADADGGLHRMDGISWTAVEVIARDPSFA